MAFNGAGVFDRLYNWVEDKANGIFARADRMDAEMDGIAAGLSNAICRDGQSVITSNLSLNGHKLTNLLVGSAAADSVRYDQLYQTATAFTPAYTASSGTPPTYTAANQGYYLKVGRLTFWTIWSQNTSGGTPGSGGGFMEVALPFAPGGVGIPSGSVAQLTFVHGVAKNSSVSRPISGIQVPNSFPTAVYLYKNVVSGSDVNLSALACDDQNNVTRQISLAGIFLAAS